MKLYADGGAELMEFLDGRSFLETWAFSPSPITPDEMWGWLDHSGHDEGHAVEIDLPFSRESLAPYQFGTNHPASAPDGWHIPAKMVVGRSMRITIYRRRHAAGPMRGQGKVLTMRPR